MSMSAPTDVPRQKTKKQELKPQSSQKIRIEKSDSRGASLTHRPFDDPRLKDLL